MGPKFDGFYRMMLGHGAALAHVVSSAHFPTYIHGKDVGYISYCIARACDLSDEDVYLTTLGSLLHDMFGKIPLLPLLRRIEGKAVSRDSDEFKEIKKHVKYGEMYFTDLKINLPEYAHWIEVLRQCAYYHHVSFDGATGYPEGVRQSDIGSKIVPIVQMCDCISAMTQAGLLRSYRKPMELGDVLEDIESKSGTLFDPHVAQVTLQVLQDAEWNFFTHM